MPMNIGNKIDTVREEIIAGTTSGAEIADEAIAAIENGLGSDAWEILMNRYANNETELKRLCGREPEFNAKDYAKHCLVYIAGDSACTAETATATGTRRTMTLAELQHRNLMELLDSD